MTTLPPTIPCPYPGIPGADNRDGSCTYPAELMDSTVVPPYYRCALHGTVQDQDQEETRS